MKGSFKKLTMTMTYQTMLDQTLAYLIILPEEGYFDSIHMNLLYQAVTSFFP